MGGTVSLGASLERKKERQHLCILSSHFWEPREPQEAPKRARTPSSGIQTSGMRGRGLSTIANERWLLYRNALKRRGLVRWGCWRQGEGDQSACAALPGCGGGGGAQEGREAAGAGRWRRRRRQLLQSRSVNPAATRGGGGWAGGLRVEATRRDE